MATTYWLLVYCLTLCCEIFYHICLGLNAVTFKREMSARFAVKIWKTARFSEIRTPYNRPPVVPPRPHTTRSCRSTVLFNFQLLKDYLIKWFDLSLNNLSTILLKPDKAFNWWVLVSVLVMEAAMVVKFRNDDALHTQKSHNLSTRCVRNRFVARCQQVVTMLLFYQVATRLPFTTCR